MDRARGQNNNTIIIFKKRWRGGRDLILIRRRTIKELIVEDVVTGGVLFIKLISTRPSPSIA
jgi:orotate phosphoribosyltransferase